MSNEATIPLSAYQKLEAENITLKQELAWLKRQMFGSKSERFIPNADQQELPLEVTPVEIVLTKEHVEYDRVKTDKKKTGGHGRGEMPTHLPFVDEIIEPQENVADCQKIGEEVTWEIDYEPGKCFVRRFIRPKYVKKNGEEDTTEIIIGKLPKRPIDKGNFGPAIMSYVTTDKYLNHNPLFRQAKEFLHHSNLVIAESTLCDIVRHTFNWLDPIYHAAKKVLLKASYLMADETTIPVLIKDSKKKTHKGYYWVYYDPINKIVIFEYRSGRSSEGPNDFLAEFRSSILQIDGYKGYNNIIETNHLTRAACMAHVRRDFYEALEFNKEAASYALGVIQKWFAIEKIAKTGNYTAQQRLALRKENNLRESFADFKSWMVKYCADALPSDAVRKACEYAFGQWDGFNAYLSDGRVELSNNLVENAIRPVTLGRKNYMFKGSEESAKRGAVIYSIIATAKLHGLDPYRYIKMLLEKLPGEMAENIEKYLPWNIEGLTKTVPA